MNSKAKKIAIWGIGKHAINRIIPAIKEVEGLRLVGICSRSKNVVKEHVENLNCFGWTDPADMLNEKDLDIIYLSTPIGLHAEQGKKVLTAGKHLWSEKPFTCDLSKSEELVNLSRKKGLTVAEGFMYLYHKQFKEICNKINTNQLGTIKEVSLKFGFPELKSPGFRLDPCLCGGALWDIGCYSISAAIHLFKNETVDVKFVDLKVCENNKIDLDGTVVLDFSCGARVISSWYYGAGYKNEINVWGENGSLYSDRIFSKVNDYVPKLIMRDKYGVETVQEVAFVNQFVEMFNRFLNLMGSEENSEQERKDIIQRAMLMNKIEQY
jgi:NDP-hexose-3-ketoreductase